MFTHTLYGRPIMHGRKHIFEEILSLVDVFLLFNNFDKSQKLLLKLQNASNSAMKKYTHTLYGRRKTSRNVTHLRGTFSVVDVFSVSNKITNTVECPNCAITSR